MPIQYFSIKTPLPHVDCTEENFYQTCRTLEPVGTAIVDGSSLAVNTAGQIVPGKFTPYFRKFTKTFADLSQTATSFDIELFQLPAAAAIQAIKLKHSAAFTGGPISAYTLSVGISGSLNKYMAAKSVFAAPTSAGFHLIWAPFYNYMAAAALSALFTTTIGAEDHVTPTSIRLAAVSTGGNLSLATAGSVDVWVMYSILS